VGHVAQLGRGEVHTGFWWGNMRETENSGDLVVDGRIILQRIFKNWGRGHGVD